MTQKRILLGIAGYKGSGKTTAAIELKGCGFHNVKFAAGLKAMLGCLGLTGDHLEGKLKEEPCGLLDGRTPRHAMQTLGGEWGRDMISPNLWINHWKRTVNSYGLHTPICVDDLRYPNEQDAIREMGGEIVYIERGLDRSSTHSSEDLSHIKSDYIIINSDTMEVFMNSVRQMGKMLTGV